MYDLQIFFFFHSMVCHLPLLIVSFAELLSLVQFHLSIFVAMLLESYHKLLPMTMSLSVSLHFLVLILEFQVGGSSEWRLTL